MLQGVIHDCAALGSAEAHLWGSMPMKSRGLVSRISAGVFATLVVASGLIVGVNAARAAVVAKYPNLRTLSPRELKLDRADVTPDLTGVFHNVLRFSNTTYNAGEGPVIVDAQIDPTT